MRSDSALPESGSARGRWRYRDRTLNGAERRVRTHPSTCTALNLRSTHTSLYGEFGSRAAFMWRRKSRPNGSRMERRSQ